MTAFVDKAEWALCFVGKAVMAGSGSWWLLVGGSFSDSVSAEW